MQKQYAQRARELCRRSTELRLAQRPVDALRAARQAHAAAAISDDELVQAHAAFVLGNALLAEFDHGADLLFGEAMRRFDEAAEAYQRLDRVDLYSVLLTMASAAFSINELDAAYSMLARVINDLADPKYATPDALARHVDHVRGRAFLELATIALADEDYDKAREDLETAATLLLAAGDHVALELVRGDIANAVEQQLGDRDRASQLRAATGRLSA